MLNGARYNCPADTGEVFGDNISTALSCFVQLKRREGVGGEHLPRPAQRLPLKGGHGSWDRVQEPEARMEDGAGQVGRS